MIYSAGSVQFYCTEPNRPLDPLLAKLQELADLPDGWRFGEGIAIDPAVLHTAQDIYRRLANFPLKADAFPGTDGSLSLVFYSDDRCVEICISQDGGLDLAVEEGEGFDFRETEAIPNASFQDVLYQITLLAQKTREWNSSDSCIHENMIETQNVFEVHASPIPVTGQAYRWLISNAFENAPRQYVSASNTIIPVS